MREHSQAIENSAGVVETFGVKGVRSTPVGLTFETDDLAFGDWQNIGRVLGAVRDWSAFAIGDWIVYGETVWPEIFAQAVEVTGRAKGTLLEYARVSRNIAHARRRPDLSFTVHQLVAAKLPPEQDRWLDDAEAHRWSVEEMRGEMQRDRVTGDALSARPRQSRARAEILEHVEDVAGAVLRAAEPLQDGYARVPVDVLYRLANACGAVWP
jgi:hypothetical protein